MFKCISKRLKKKKINKNNVDNSNNGFKNAEEQIPIFSKEKSVIKFEEEVDWENLQTLEKITEFLLGNQVNSFLRKGVILKELIQSIKIIGKKEKIEISKDIYDQIKEEELYLFEYPNNFIIIREIIVNMKLILEEDMNRILFLDENKITSINLPDLLIESYCNVFQIIKAYKMSKDLNFKEKWWINSEKKRLTDISKEQEDNYCIGYLKNKFIEISGKIKYELHKRGSLNKADSSKRASEPSFEYIIKHSPFKSKILIQNVEKLEKKSIFKVDDEICSENFILDISERKHEIKIF